MAGILHSLIGVALITVVIEKETYAAYMPRLVGVIDGNENSLVMFLQLVSAYV